jgi:hypothetical protein
MVYHDNSDGLVVVAKVHPRKILRQGNFPNIDAALIQEELVLSKEKSFSLFSCGSMLKSFDV